MLELYVQVETDVRPIHFIAAIIGTRKILLNLNSQAPILFAVLHFVQLHVLVLQLLSGSGGTYSLLTYACSCELFSDMSLMREKLS